MARFVGYEACPKCVRQGRDSRGDNLGRWDDGGGHCFSCGYHQFPKHYSKPVEIPNEQKALLPRDFTREVPTRALQWLLQYGLPYSYWQENLGYSAAEERLVFVVGSPISFSIGRYVGDSQRTPAPRKWYVWGDSHKHVELIGNGDTVVLVEDLISAHKVAYAGYMAVPLFGAIVYPCHLYYLLSTDANVVLWLDKDQELPVRKRALQLESLINRPVKVVTTDKDPKELSFTQIGELI
jgi:hypothetical protein